MDTSEEKQLLLDKRYIRMAQIWAENSYCNRRKVGALIVKDKMIISDLQKLSYVPNSSGKGRVAGGF